ncbi:MAG: glycosyltransferase family 2 protein, partial [Primorskyibacter sp.]
HQMIGVTRFLVYSNDCRDGTEAVLSAVSDALRVTHLPNPEQGRHYQMEALRAARKHPAVQDADWVWISDVDEFLNIHVGDHSIPALVAACRSPQAISLSFRFFANDGVDLFEDTPVIAQFQACHAPDIWAADLAIEVKTLVRNDFPLRHFGAHRPFVRGEDMPLWTDGSGRMVPKSFTQASNDRRLRRFPATGARRYGTLNHYALRSLDSYLIKRDRGDVNRPNRAFDTDYWADRNDIQCRDDSILRHLPALQDRLKELRTDPAIDAAHRAAVRWHTETAKALRKTPDGVALIGALRTCPPIPRAEWALCTDLGITPG